MSASASASTAAGTARAAFADHAAAKPHESPRLALAPRFDAIRCKKCGLCAHICPPGILEPPVRSTPTLPEPEACTGCRTCEYICPDFAIKMAER